jgi:hypothetical protein
MISGRTTGGTFHFLAAHRANAGDRGTLPLVTCPESLRSICLPTAIYLPPPALISPSFSSLSLPLDYVHLGLASETRSWIQPPGVIRCLGCVAFVEMASQLMGDVLHQFIRMSPRTFLICFLWISSVELYATLCCRSYI